MIKEAGFIDWLTRNGIPKPTIGMSAAFTLFSWFMGAGGDPGVFLQTVQAAPSVQVAKSNLDKALKQTLEFEGGYVNNPKDPGGETNKGITRRTYENWLKKNKKPYNRVNMRSIPEKDVKGVYKDEFWAKIKGDQLPYSVAQQLFDFSVNSGTGRAVKVVQRIVGARQTGIMDSNTVQLISNFVKKNGEQRLATEILNNRKNFLSGIKNKTFQKGWMSRVEKMRSNIK